MQPRERITLPVVRRPITSAGGSGAGTTNGMANPPSPIAVKYSQTDSPTPRRPVISPIYGKIFGPHFGPGARPGSPDFWDVGAPSGPHLPTGIRAPLPIVKHNPVVAPTPPNQTPSTSTSSTKQPIAIKPPFFNPPPGTVDVGPVRIPVDLPKIIHGGTSGTPTGAQPSGNGTPTGGSTSGNNTQDQYNGDPLSGGTPPVVGQMLQGASSGVAGSGNIADMVPSASAAQTTTTKGGANSIALIAILAAVGIIGFYFYSKHKKKAPEGNE